VRHKYEGKEAIMKLLLVALAALVFAGCAVVPVPAPVPFGYVSPGVSVDVGVGPVYRGGYGYPYRYYGYRPYGYRYWH
jgi:hypothetical protein